jgi:hypothetical protein
VLKHVKENDLAHGEFGKWLESVGIEGSQARRFMKVVEELGVNRGTYHDLGLRALYEIATLPECCPVATNRNDAADSATVYENSG